MEIRATHIAAAAAVLTAFSAGAAPKRPNIVLVISDDTRMLDFGCYGSPDAVTPNIDRLASEGLRFTRFFQATAMSSPTRHCLLTGLYPVRSGAYPNHTYIDDGVQTLPKYLKDCGYRVAMQGKRHIAPMSAFPFEELAKPNADVNPAKIEPFFREAAAGGPTVLPLRGLARCPHPVDARRPLSLRCGTADSAPDAGGHTRNQGFICELSGRDQPARHRHRPHRLPAEKIRAGRRHHLHLHQRAGTPVPVRQVDLLRRGAANGLHRALERGDPARHDDRRPVRIRRRDPHARGHRLRARFPRGWTAGVSGK